MTLAVAACVNSPTGRSQFKLYSDQKMSKAGDQSYKKLRKQKQIDHNKANNRFVSCVVKNLSRVTKHKWRVTVFKSDQANAFAIPGGNIGVYSGILPVTHNDAQLAAVLGHEMGHVKSGHANERMSQKAATSVGLSVLSAAIGSQTGGIGQRSIMGLLGTGAKIGVLLPFSRAQEAEADRIGLDLMAKAGFDPRQAVNLWRNMAEQGGEKPPQLLSTHPSDRNRIQNLEKHMTKALAIYRRAPRHPNCQHP
ncbi:M48 family metallopeptidase [Salinisphaera sp. USBA-960]|nr:M48 family metallopeptidase [Salifodinibacter halophilus]NNC27226.1 M48 family metallopeptidase [Salifodinibacter halophilus]